MSSKFGKRRNVKIRKIFYLMLVIVLCTNIIGCGNKKETKENDIKVNAVHNYETDVPGKEYVENFCRFSAGMLPQFISEEKNSCISPISMYTSMCVMYDMFDDVHKKNMDSVLLSGEMKVLESYKDCLERMKDLPYGSEADYELDGNVEMYMSLWLSDKENLNTKVTEQLKNKYNLDVFDGKYNIDEINNWMKEKDDTSVSVEGDILAHNNPVFINQLNVDLFWEVPFEKEESGKFTLINESKKDVTYMTLDASKNATITSYYAKGNNYIAVMKPLSKANSGMIFVLPDENVKLNDIINEKNFNEIFATLLSNDNYAKVNYKVPKFEISDLTDENDIYDYLRKSGMTDFKIKSLYENEEIEYTMRQYNNINVNKVGCFASSATVDFQAFGANETDIVIDLDLDRPFIYILMNNGVPFYAGTVIEPN